MSRQLVASWRDKAARIHTKTRRLIRSLTWRVAVDDAEDPAAVHALLSIVTDIALFTGHIAHLDADTFEEMLSRSRETVDCIEQGIAISEKWISRTDGILEDREGLPITTRARVRAPWWSWPARAGVFSGWTVALIWLLAQLLDSARAGEQGARFIAGGVGTAAPHIACGYGSKMSSASFSAQAPSNLTPLNSCILAGCERGKPSFPPWQWPCCRLCSWKCSTSS